MKALSEDLEMFYILIWLVVTCMYRYVKAINLHVLLYVNYIYS